MDLLALLRLDRPESRGPACPPDDVWTKVAAGIAGENAESYLSHAATCDHCGPLLRRAAADLSTELTPDEERMISNLTSSAPAWQQSLAAKLNQSGTLTGKAKTGISWRPSWLEILPSYGRLALAISIVSLILFGILIATYQVRKRSAEHLIADAFAERRTLEVRIEGAPYVPLRQERGSTTDQDRMNRPALLKAESEISQRLRSNPNDVRWLQASGRAGLLEDDPQGIEAAIASLEKARRLAPSDESVSIDLASAYIGRGQLYNRPSDFGVAIEELGSVLASDPKDEVAQFNYAIALEKLQLKTRAEDAWQAFLRDHPNSSWAVEARERLISLRKEISERDRRSEYPLMSALDVANAFSGQRKELIDDIDARVEEYQDRAIQLWLPAYFDSRSSLDGRAKNFKTALVGLSNLLKDRHGDCWLADMLALGHSSHNVRNAFALLSLSEHLIESSDDGPVEHYAAQASEIFHRVQFTAGESRAQFDLALVAQLQHRKRPCKNTADALLKRLSGKKYAWIEIQSDLEAGLCSDVSDSQALRDLRIARDAASAHRYRILALRAAMFESEMYWSLGDELRAWSVSAAGLQTFWAGSYPRLRGYNFLISMDDLVARHHQPFLETAILKEAVPMIDSEPRPAMAAFEHARLGQIQLESGEIDGAEKSFQRARSLFDKLSPGSRRDALVAETALGLAKVEFERGDAAAAADRLQQIRAAIALLPDDRLQLDYFQIAGRVSLSTGLLTQAETDLDSAVGLAEKGLRSVGSEDDRWQWIHLNEASYRGIVELKLKSDPQLALNIWEWYKGAPLRSAQFQPSQAGSGSRSLLPKGVIDSSDVNPGTAIVSYFLLANNAIVWVWDSTGYHVRSLSIPKSRLVDQVNRFVEQCSSPDSQTNDIRSEGAELYKELFYPVEPWLSRDHKIVIEPDGVLRKLPFEALVDGVGHFLVDDFEVSISLGIDYLHSARKWTGVSPSSEAFILGDPEVRGWNSLPDAEQEARLVAAFFRSPHLLLRSEASNVDLDEMIAQADIFHFAGHALANIQSVGVVVDANAPSNIHNFETKIRGRSQLIVLSACSTSLGSAGMFDDRDSLVRRLLEDHVPEIVASRWSVDSVATRHLMAAFYSNLLSGQPVPAALASAERSLRTEPGFSRPYYWAGFSVFGMN